MPDKKRLQDKNLEPDDKHQNAVNILIESANQIAADQNPGLAASALMQAAARYASFYVASSSESRKDFKEDKDSLIQDISREFKRLFSEDLEDYIENYKIYLPEKSEEE